VRRFAVIVIPLIAAGLFAQDTLRVAVNLVTVSVRVTDARGRNVLGLKAEDFSIFDDGVRQKIEFFSSEEQPITLGILLDRSSSMDYHEKFDRAKEAARTLIRSTREGSEYFYFAFDDQVKLAADFTMDRDKVQSAIDRTTIGNGTSLYDATIEALTLCSRAQLPRQALIIISDGQICIAAVSFRKRCGLSANRKRRFTRSDTSLRRKTISCAGRDRRSCWRTAGPWIIRAMCSAESRVSPEPRRSFREMTENFRGLLKRS
jgi:VWFA-related protein